MSLTVFKIFLICLIFLSLIIKKILTYIPTVDTYGTPLAAPLGGSTSNSLNGPISAGSTYSSVSNSLPLEPRTPPGNTNTGNTFASNHNSWQNPTPQAPSTMANVKVRRVSLTPLVRF